jgi:hypothetical protein
MNISDLIKELTTDRPKPIWDVENQVSDRVT